jgi:acetyl esterase
MTREEMICEAREMRSRDRFGPLTPEELAALPGTEQELAIPIGMNRTVHVYEIRPSAPLSAGAPMILNYHGGGFVKGRADRDRRYCSFLAEQLHCLIWDVDYCLAPEQPFPAAVNESYAVAAYAFAHAQQLGVDPARIALAGHSAGGNLVATVCLQAGQTGAFKPCAALMEYFPATHLVDPLDRLSETQRADERAVARAAMERKYIEFYCNDEDAKDPLCSVLLANREALAAFPDSLVISAGKDSLCDETEAFARQLVAAGVTVTVKRIPEAMHGFTTNRTEGWEKALALHCKFFGQYL